MRSASQEDKLNNRVTDNLEMNEIDTNQSCEEFRIRSPAEQDQEFLNEKKNETQKEQTELADNEKINKALEVGISEKILQELKEDVEDIEDEYLV